jgi:hypothetical protein
MKSDSPKITEIRKPPYPFHKQSVPDVTEEEKPESSKMIDLMKMLATIDTMRNKVQNNLSKYTTSCTPNINKEKSSEEIELNELLCKIEAKRNLILYELSKL